MSRINRNKLLHECYYPQCHILVKGDTQYCPKHYQLVTGKWQSIKSNQRKSSLGKMITRQYDKNGRDQEATAFYHSVPWTRVRNYVVSRDGYTSAITGRVLSDHDIIVDHIVRRDLVDNPLDTSNLWCLSRAEHNRKTKIELRILKQVHGKTKLKHLTPAWWAKVLREEKGPDKRVSQKP